MIEAELKAVVRQSGALLRRLEGRYGPGRAEVYRDTYYDAPGGELLDGDRELRIREVEGADGSRRTLLTYKDARVDEASGSKPEYETVVADAGAAHGIVRGLGYLPRLAFEKRCRNYAVERAGRRFLVTLVRVPGLDGVYLEVETAAAGEDELTPALAAVRELMAELGIEHGDFTSELYTDAVARRGRGAGGGGTGRAGR
ncbi:CYTH domain-containing protein [Streptomyces kaniharaensis]|uniref:CYTH domain-containing protein n=1 Tax=Streptomyces kaniharaensis TaxID=212423 RepID=A0A6N7KXK3_9ACTN|nr:CYTH domain-containing protein [Streptomyces kaniharaensis]MQS14988.1 CYTH domain-containing protein [Streptomyces kaniharaensis]